MIIERLDINNKSIEGLYSYLSNIYNKIANTNLYYIKEIDLSTWNMQSVATKTYTYATDNKLKDLIINGYLKIKSANFLIIGDDNTRYIINKGISISFNSSSITIERESGGTFDNSNFSSTTNSRGLLILWISV